MSPRESNPDQMTLRLHGRQAVVRAVAAARKFGKAQQLTGDDLARLCIVIEELIANLYDHGRVTERDQVRLALAREPRGIHVSIFDPGSSFDPWSTPQTAESIERGGGAGVRLIQAWAELISYRSSSQGNCLEILLPVRQRD